MKRMILRNALIAAAFSSATIFGTTAPVLAQMGGSGMGPGMMGGAAVEPRSDGARPPAVDAERGPKSGYGYSPGYGMGPGMMGGYGPGHGMGPGMMGGYGPGYGMDPGMMGGYGMGPGMMGGMMGHMMGGGYGMGPGMMGGYGHGYGMGPGMMGGAGYGMLNQLNLSPEQWTKVTAIQRDLAKKNWDLTGKMQEESVKLHDLTAAEKRDRSAITSQYKKLQDLRLQQFQARLDAQEKIDGALTKEQKAQLRRFGSW